MDAPSVDAASAVQIRRLSMDDYDAMIRLWLASGVGAQVAGRESREAMTRQFESGLQTALGALIEGQLVGVVLITHDGRKGWINRLGVLPSFQRRGIGRALIRAGEAQIASLGLEISAALVEHHNAASLALFQSEGYHLNQTYYLTKRKRPNA